MINRLKLYNFKAYKNEEFNFSNLTVFCGNNSVGKSTAIQALSIPLQSYFERNAQLNGNLVELGYLNDLHHQSATDSNLKIELEINSHIMSWGYRDIDEQEKESNKHLSTLIPPLESSKESIQNIVGSLQFLQAERYG
ncbi:AAA family ATPase [Vibrio harveyi]|nr:AAA family ATPase [Vibrio harveyi]